MVIGLGPVKPKLFRIHRDLKGKMFLMPATQPNMLAGLLLV
jgi:hypothetical protein